jgi:hypothetical protein
MIGFEGRHQWRRQPAIQASCQAGSVHKIHILHAVMALAEQSFEPRIAC